MPSKSRTRRLAVGAVLALTVLFGAAFDGCGSGPPVDIEAN